MRGAAVAAIKAQIYLKYRHFNHLHHSVILFLKDSVLYKESDVPRQRRSNTHGRSAVGASACRKHLQKWHNLHWVAPIAPYLPDALPLADMGEVRQPLLQTVHINGSAAGAGAGRGGNAAGAGAAGAGTGEEGGKAGDKQRPSEPAARPYYIIHTLRP